jgi:hypothetical protein
MGDYSPGKGNQPDFQMLAPTKQGCGLFPPLSVSNKYKQIAKYLSSVKYYQRISTQSEK